MCGITGIFYTDFSETAPKDLLEAMTSSLIHRGPDDGAVYIDGAVGLGHRRLAVIDLEGGKQPIFNEDRNMCIVFNGEIYNFRELQKELKNIGHRFETNCDTEVILHSYEEFGEDCIHHLRGMFAFAIWDREKRKLFLARDRMGIKPLCYYWNGRKFLFASEIKAILQDPTVKREIDLLALEDYLTYGYIPTPKTIFQGIRKLPAGHILTISPEEGPKESEYWDLVFEPKDGLGEARYAGRLFEELRESVELHIISDVTLGALLSGGIDSSAVVGLMAGLVKKPLKTVSVGFRESEFSELPYARVVAQSFQTHNYEKIVEASDFKILDSLTWQHDEPFADPAMIPNYYVSQVAREHMTVSLSGDGGDENFAGYSRFSDFMENCANNGRTSAEESFFKHKSFLMPEMKSQLYRDSLRNSLEGYDSFSVMKTYFDNTRGWEPLSGVQYVETKTYLIDDVLTKVDITSMANSLEVRVPLLDHKLVEYVTTIPARFKLQNGMEKYIFKIALKNLLPSKTLKRGKMGFSVPLVHWFRNGLKELFEQKVLSKNAFIGEFFNLNTIRQWWTQHQQRDRDYARQLWILLVLECWGEKLR